jgi:hypothetical protein
LEFGPKNGVFLRRKIKVELCSYDLRHCSILKTGLDGLNG